METAVLPGIPPQKPTKFRFSKETAAEYGRRGAAATNGLKAITAELSPAAAPAEQDRYTQRRLLRVRKQLDMIDDEIDSAIKNEPASVKSLVEAQSRLSEQERFLANRPGPGTRKPKAEPTKRQNQSCDPVDE